MTEVYSKPSNLRKELRALLDKDPLLTAKPLAKLLNVSYKQYKSYLSKERCEWKVYHENERGSKCSSFHCVRFGLWELVRADRDLAVRVGWVLSRSRNRFLVFKSSLGRVVWFETGTVRLHVRVPANEGRAKQLFCDAFFRNGLIGDVKVLERCLSGLFLDSFHTVVRTNQRLPYVHVNDFSETNGFEFKSGDRSHPHCFEFIIRYQDQYEEARRLFEDLMRGVQQSVNGANGAKPLNGEDYAR
jgi:hypothetical protein